MTSSITDRHMCRHETNKVWLFHGDTLAPFLLSNCAVLFHPVFINYLWKPTLGLFLSDYVVKNLNQISGVPLLKVNILERQSEQTMQTKDQIAY